MEVWGQVWYTWGQATRGRGHAVCLKHSARAVRGARPGGGLGREGRKGVLGGGGCSAGVLRVLEGRMRAWFSKHRHA